MSRTKRLLIIGGLSCAGKTRLIQRIRRGDCPHLCHQLGIGNPASWRFVNASDVPRLEATAIERLVVHYNFYAKDFDARGPRRFADLDGLLRMSESATILTLFVQPEMLVRRSTSRIVKILTSWLRNPTAYARKTRILRKLWAKRTEYKDPSRVFARYDDWFDFVNQIDVASHWLLDPASSDAEARPYAEQIGAQV